MGDGQVAAGRQGVPEPGHDPERVANVRIGLASHNLFDVAYAWLLAGRRGVRDRIEFEMLQGMAVEQARAVSARRQQLVEAVEGAAWLQARRNGRASSVEVIDALSSRIPDGAYLEKLAIEGQQLTLIGLSNEAAALVGRLEGAGAWEAPALAGALQQDPRTRMDRFTLVAKLRGATDPDAGRGAR